MIILKINMQGNTKLLNEMTSQKWIKRQSDNTFSKLYKKHYQQYHENK